MNYSNNQSISALLNVVLLKRKDKVYIKLKNYGAVGCRWQGVGRRGAAAVASLRRGQGLPHAGHRLFQTAPMDPPQDTTEPLTQDGGTSVETCLGMGKMLHSSEE